MGEEWEQDWGVGKELGKKNRELVKMEKRLMAEAAETRALPSACPGYIFFQPLNAGAARKVGAGDTGTVGAHLRVTSGRLRSREHSSALTPNPDPAPRDPCCGASPSTELQHDGAEQELHPQGTKKPLGPQPTGPGALFKLSLGLSPQFGVCGAWVSASSGASWMGAPPVD